MKKGVLFAIVLTVVILAGLIGVNTASATDIDSCQTISSSGTYTLTQNVSSSGTCFTINAANVILDCQGYTINFSTSDTGIGVYCNSNSTTIRNCIIREGVPTSDSNGILFNHVNNGFITNSQVFTYGKDAWGLPTNGILLNRSNYNLITNTNATSGIGASGDYTTGLRFYSSNYNNVTNYHGVAGYNGIGFTGGWPDGGSNYNNIVNSSSLGMMDNIYIDSESSYNNFTNGYFTTQYGSGALNFGSEENWFVNSVIISYQHQLESMRLGNDCGEYYLVNCTTNISEYMTVESGALNRFWYVDVYVNDSNGNAISGANPSAYDVNNVLTTGSLTNSSGYTRMTLRQYMHNSSGVYYDTNYTFTASKSGYSYDSFSGPLNLTTNYIGSDKVWITLTDDTALTALFGTNPINNYNSNSSNMTFDFRCSYNSNVDTIQLWTNTTGVWHANYTNSSYTNGTWLNITVPGIQNGNNYNWAVFCNTSGSSDWTGNRTFNVDLIDPVAEQGTNPIAGYQDSAGEITFDLKCSDNLGISTIQLLTNKSGDWQADYSNASYQNDTWLNITIDGITSGNYAWQVYCEDTAGNSHTTSSRSFSSTYVEEEGGDNPPGGGGGGGGGGSSENPINQIQENNTNNSNESNGNENAGNENENGKGKFQLKDIIVYAAALVVVALIIIFIVTRKKKNTVPY